MSSKPRVHSQPGQLNEQDIYLLQRLALEHLAALTPAQKIIVLSFALRTVETQQILEALQEHGR